MSGRTIEALCVAILLTGCLVGGSAATGRVLPAIPELIAIPLFVLTAAARSDLVPHARTRWAVVAAILGLPAIQLVPLPSDVWSALPGRAPVAEAYASAGLALPWLPISLTPGATERIWLGLLPATALFVAVPYLATHARTRLTHLAILIGVLDVALGVAQVAGGTDSPLRLYATASRTDAVGLFANRNHHATFLTLLVLFVGGLLADLGRRTVAERAWLSIALVILMLGIVASGSRAGLALGMFAFLAAIWSFLVDRPVIRRWRYPMAWGSLVTVLLIVGLGIAGPATLRLQANAVTGDLRWQIAHTTVQALAEVFPVGGGLGSFERLYARIERPDERAAAVINNAHDDWLELILEGGLAAALMLVVALAYLCRETIATVRPANGGANWPIRRTTLAALWICALHETVDYPLRTMAVNLVLALACGLRAAPPLQPSAGPNRHRRDTGRVSSSRTSARVGRLPSGTA